MHSRCLFCKLWFDLRPSSLKKEHSENKCHKSTWLVRPPPILRFLLQFHFTLLIWTISLSLILQWIKEIAAVSDNVPAKCSFSHRYLWLLWFFFWPFLGICFFPTTSSFISISHSFGPSINQRNHGCLWREKVLRPLLFVTLFSLFQTHTTERYLAATSEERLFSWEKSLIQKYWIKIVLVL